MLIENILIALNSIKANKLRSILTMLGIIIGIGSVIAIVTIGDSIASSVNKEMQSYGARNIEVYVSNKSDAPLLDPEDPRSLQPTPEAKTREMTDGDLITISMIEDYEKAFKDQLKSVSIEESVGSSTPKNKIFKSNITLLGSNIGYKDYNRLKMLAGDYIGEKDIKNKTNHVVVSDKFVKEYFGHKYTNEQALGKTFEVDVNKKMMSLYIIGVYKFEANRFTDKSTPTNAIIPYSTALHFNRKKPMFQSFKVAPIDDLSVTKFQLDTNTFLSSYYTHNEYYSVTTFGLTSMIKSQTDLMNKLRVGISAIAAISLLVGGIGIMNIMMVSVTERTREIGIRMALGAKGSTIRTQFIIEAVFVSGIGGLIGIILGVIAGAIGSKIMGYPAQPSIQAALIAVTFSMAIGVFFGYYPANKAAHLDPIDALRYE